MKFYSYYNHFIDNTVNATVGGIVTVVALLCIAGTICFVVFVLRRRNNKTSQLSHGVELHNISLPPSHPLPSHTVSSPHPPPAVPPHASKASVSPHSSKGGTRGNTEPRYNTGRHVPLPKQQHVQEQDTYEFVLQ